VIERPDQDDIQAVFGHRPERELILGELGQPVRARRPEPGVLVDRLTRIAVHERRRHHEHAARASEAPDRLEQVIRAEDVDLQGLQRVLPGRPDVRGAGEVIDARRA